jgi:hypothetical protein
MDPPRARRNFYIRLTNFSTGAHTCLLRNQWDELQMNERLLISPSPLNGERFPRTSSRFEPLNPRRVGRVTPCAPVFGSRPGGAHGVTRPTWWFMERAGVRGGSVEQALVLQGRGAEDPPHLTLPQPRSTTPTTSVTGIGGGPASTPAILPQAS